MRQVEHTSKYLVGSFNRISLCASVAFGTISLVGIIQKISGVPINGLGAYLYGEYAKIRDLLFQDVWNALLGNWLWIDFPDLPKDLISIYLLFGFSFARSVFAVDIIGYNRKRQTARYGFSMDEPICAKRLYVIALLWPLNLGKKILDLVMFRLDLLWSKTRHKSEVAETRAALEQKIKEKPWDITLYLFKESKVHDFTRFSHDLLYQARKRTEILEAQMRVASYFLLINLAVVLFLYALGTFNL